MTNITDMLLDISDILDALPFYVMLVDENHHILQANRATREHLGLNPEAIAGKYCPEVIHGVKEPWYACPLEEALEKDQPVEREAIDRSSGRWIRSAIYPIRRLTPDGQKIFFHMVSDITDRKQAEKEAETARLALKTYVTHVVNVQEEERRRIARELHDQTIQKLVFLSRELESLSTHECSSATTAEKLQKAREIGSQVVEDLRNFAKDLRPPALDDLGLVDSINRLLMDFGDRTGIKPRLALAGSERRLSADTEVGIFRIIQEALQNVERHSKAQNVVITTTFKSDNVVISIQDNGVGFNVTSTGENLAANHFGLVGMQERAELSGGKLDIKSAPQKGTTITISIPVSD